MNPKRASSKYATMTKYPFLKSFEELHIKDLVHKYKNNPCNPDKI